MGRRTAAETAALRERVVDCAIARFADQGMATTMAEIARDVGLSKQALMHHFRNRNALDEAIVERFRTRLNESLPLMVSVFTCKDAQLDHLLDEILHTMEENRHLTRFALRRIA